MKKLAFALSIIFIILTFVGAGYVLYNSGKVNAGYACVPMVLALASIRKLPYLCKRIMCLNCNSV